MLCLFVYQQHLCVIVIEKKLHTKSWIKTFVLSALGFSYSLWAIYGSGSETVYLRPFTDDCLEFHFMFYMQWIKSKEIMKGTYHSEYSSIKYLFLLNLQTMHLSLNIFLEEQWQSIIHFLESA